MSDYSSRKDLGWQQQAQAPAPLRGAILFMNKRKGTQPLFISKTGKSRRGSLEERI
jgi:hypothetical protein